MLEVARSKPNATDVRWLQGNHEQLGQVLRQHGQSVGKRLLGIKIVRTDGARAGLGRIFSLRILVPNVIYMVPILGALFALVDALFIFRDDRRCIHDLMADTQVIAA